MGVFTMSEQEPAVKVEDLDVEFLVKVLLYMRRHDVKEEIVWNEKLEMFVLANDLFYWACSDYEPLTRENFAELEKAMQEVKALDEYDWEYGPLLFCCRQRKMRPQKPYYKHLPESLHPLFDACGGEQGDRG